jgi:small-conductance mechanosensitive channel
MLTLIELPRLVACLFLVFAVPPIAMVIGNRLERIQTRPDRPIRSWLSEIGSDIRWLLISLTLLAAVTIAVYPFFRPSLNIAIVLSKLNLTVFFLLIAIAGVSCLAAFSEHLINTKGFSKNDKRNLLTLLPIATSAIKLCIYFLFCLLFLASLSVDIRPFLETGAIAAIILGIAGQNILSDMLSTLFIFTDRLFYVGDCLSILCGEEWIEGVVLSISLRYTILDRGNGQKIAIANRTLDKFQKIENLGD